MLRTIALIILLASSFSTYAQGTAADYRRAQIADTAYVGKVHNLALDWEWLDDSKRFWYVKVVKGGKEFVMTDPTRKTKGKAFDHQKLAKALSDKSKKPVNANKLPFDEIKFKDGGSTMEFVVDSVRWQCKLSTYEVRAVERLKPGNRRYWGTRWDERSGGPVISPDSTWAAVIRNANVYIRNF